MLGKPTKLQHDYAGKIVNWFHLDNIENFRVNCPKYYTEDSIEYRFNSSGFRMDKELSDIPEGCNLFLGDSNSMGYGVNLEDTWCYRLNRVLGGDFVNLSCAGAGSDTIYRLAKIWIPVLKPKNIFVWEPPRCRMEYIENEEFITSGIWTLKNDPPETFEDNLFCRVVANFDADLINRQRSKDALSYITEKNNINLYWKDLIIWNDEYFGESRDGLHCGPRQHEKILNEFVLEHGFN